MEPVRRLILTHRRLWLTLVVAALFVRALVPVGWMPVATAHGVAIVLCPGAGPVVGHASHHAGMHHDKKSGHDMGRDHPCVFAGVGQAQVAAEPAPPIAAPALPPVFVPLRRTTVTVGRGLAAPPPPPTGPPALA